ncbi:NAD(P)H-quinone oxidoreductase [Alteribacillus sp. YIM 98480]|uniref:NAD(P)H-quinone oxidoreductase n=1 Tax=Alteribacillus sp. YIM 98480 TaxID=2606599 RepID=UPI00131E3AE9|nr:NAD(P)H-quinone oxidoreductase [Alteribacillus sp. YIM 98480]
MKAILIKEADHSLYIGDYEDPAVGENDILINAKATAINRADLMQREGKYPPPPGASPILGLEVAGTIERMGEKVEGWKKGDRVCALLPGGGYAAKVSIPSDMAIKIPENLSFEEASAIPEAYLTAFLNLFTISDLQQGEDVLIHAGASGVGTAAIQLAKEKQANVIVTAGSNEKLRYCEKLGADIVINYKHEDFSKIVLETTNNKGADIILDFIGASYWEQNMKAVAIDGRWILISALGGSKTNVELGKIIGKRISIVGTTLRPRTLEFKTSLVNQFKSFAMKKFENGQLLSIVDQVFNWRDAEDAHKFIEENKNIGKVVLKID